MNPGELSPGNLVAMLRALGFDKVLDTNTATYLTTVVEATRALMILKITEENPWPLFTSCCPGWMNTVEKADPTMELGLADQISTCKSPHMMYGSLMKEYSKQLLGVPAEEQYLCSAMPCVRKRGESDQEAFVREDGIRQVDNVITTQDLGALCRLKGIDPQQTGAASI